MKFKSLILIIIAGIAFSCKPAHHDIRISQFLIDSIKSQEIPDSRVEVLHIKASYIGNDLLLKGRTTKPEAVSKLEARLKQQQVSFIDSIVRLPDPALGDKTWALVNLTVANLRTEPAHAAEMATQALIGTPLKVLQKEKTWYLVQTPDQYIAWIDSVEIEPLTAAEIKIWKESDRLIYLKDNGVILNSTERNARPVSDMGMGGIVTVDKNGKRKGSSIPIELPDGRKGFMNSKDCRNFKEW
ncbi:MAG: SH3 domain-containing protein, partial [Bacteroidales bacterium]|nr:SH3 domain-containing protein [Bacteroidales bacterium]